MFLFIEGECRKALTCLARANLCSDAWRLRTLRSATVRGEFLFDQSDTLLSYRWMLGRGWRQDFEPPIARLRKQEPITLGYPCYSRHPWSVSGLRIISGRSRYRVNQFNLRAHFLDFGILRFQNSNEDVHLLFQLGNHRFLLLNFTRLIV